MEYKPVSSSNIAAIGFDDATNTLGVQFLNGTEYHYFGVPLEVYEGLLNAPSKGSYLNELVKKSGYAYSRVG